MPSVCDGAEMREKRKLERAACLRRCEVLFVNGTKGYRIPGRVINQSAYGLMLELDHEIEVGDRLLRIIIKNDHRNGGKASDEEVLKGMVRWCKAQNDCFSGMYHIGVEIVSLKPRKDVI